MKKKLALVSFTIIVLGIGSFYLTDGYNSQANELANFNFEQAIHEGYVIQHEDQILNIMRLQQFFENVNNEIDDSISILINPTNRHNELLELHFQEGTLLLYFDIQQNAQGYKEFRISQYRSITRVLNGDQVEFVLVGANSEKPLLSYRLSNE